MQYKIKCNDYESMGLLYDVMITNTKYDVVQCYETNEYNLIVTELTKKES